jgi:hypothetical protein
VRPTVPNNNVGDVPTANRIIGRDGLVKFPIGCTPADFDNIHLFKASVVMPFSMRTTLPLALMSRV